MPNTGLHTTHSPFAGGFTVEAHYDCSSGGSDPTSARGAGREPPCAREPARYETSKSTRLHQR
jgi:hypothetical protein